MRYHLLCVSLLVLVSDLLVFFFSCHVLAARVYPGRQDYLASLLLVLLNPTLVLIDHGHFQYNCVSLGLAQLAAFWLVRGGNKYSGRLATLSGLVVGSVFFCLALNFKQMELYHALPFFFFILAACIREPRQPFASNLVHLGCVAFTVLATFALLWLPFILLGPQSVLQVLQRVFPFQRGLFEVSLSLTVSSVPITTSA
jgi:alpha-1,3-glucosyltransferase